MDSNNRGKNEEKKNSIGICRKLRKDCPKCVQIDEFYNRNDISDDDFVENPYGYGLREKNDVETPKAKTKTKTKTKASTSSVVTDPKTSTSENDFVPCTFKAHYKK